MAAPGISPSDLIIGQLVDIEARTWSFINKPGGAAKITHIHYDANHVARSVDVIYSLGGRESNLELTYVKMYVEVVRTSRSRKRDVKMNVDTLGGQQSAKSSEEKNMSDEIEKEKKTKKQGMEGGESARKKKKKDRMALASIDRNQTQTTSATTRGAQVESLERASDTDGAKLALLQQVRMSSTEKKKKTDGPRASKQIVWNEKKKKGLKDDGNESTMDTASSGNKNRIQQHESKKSKAHRDVELDQPKEANGKWELIQNGKITDYVHILQNGQRISYWWSDEDGWLKGNVSKGLKKVVTATTIKWTITLAFDNGDKHTLSFHPLDKRWKILHPPTTKTTYSSVVDEMQRKKSVAVKQSSSTKSTDGEKNDAPTKELKSFGEKSVASTKTAKKSAGREKRVSEITCTSIKKSEVVNNEKQGLKNSSNSTSATKSSSTIKPTGYKQLSLSFGLQVQPRKVQEASSNIHTFKNTPSLSMENLSGASSLLPPDILTPDNTKNASQHNRNQTIISSNKGKQFVGTLGQKTSLDCCPPHRIVTKSVEVTGNSKLPSEEAITDYGDQQKAGQTEDPRYESKMKKRKEHMDHNHNDINHESKKTKVEIVEKRDEVAGEADGTWELIQDGKITDYIDLLQKGQRVSYWWNDEDGWFKGNISKGLERVVTTSTIKWTVTVTFDSGDKHAMSFHPRDKRWQVLHPRTELSSLAMDEYPAQSKIAKPVGENGVVHIEYSNKKPKANRRLADVGKNVVKSNEKSSTLKPKGYKQLSLSFGLQLQSKVQEVASKIQSSSTSAKTGHTMSAESAEETGKSALLPPKTTISDDAKNSQDIREDLVACENASQVSLISSLSLKHYNPTAKPSKNSLKSSTSLTSPSQLILQTLYKKECEKANEFVGYMTAPTKTNSIRDGVAALSPGVLELIFDQKREDQFNSLLSEIMYNQRLDMMDVEKMIERMNKRQKSCKPFTLLEVKPFLQKLHKDNRIFMVEEEGKNGVVYAI